MCGTAYYVDEHQTHTSFFSDISLFLWLVWGTLADDRIVVEVLTSLTRMAATPHSNETAHLTFNQLNASFRTTSSKLNLESVSAEAKWDKATFRNKVSIMPVTHVS